MTLLFIACNNSEQNNLHKTSTDDNKFKLEAERISGTWLTSHYLDQIKEKKSIYAAKYDTELFEVSLDITELLGDTAILYGATEHEGGYMSPICFDPKKNLFVNDSSRKEDGNTTEEFELMIGAEGKLHIHFTKDNKTDIYKKVDDVQTELRSILFSGNYHKPGNEHAKAYEFGFGTDGTLEGFGKRKYYEVAFDFGLGINFDTLILFDKEEHNNWNGADLYKFEFKGDTMLLYPVTSNWDEMEQTVGALKYTLVRSK